jgi:GTP-binding protein EngB required for normal cell division
MLTMSELSGGTRQMECQRAAVTLAREIIDRFALWDLDPLLNVITSRMEKDELNVAVFGRFKAGKTSFLNSLVGRSLLPVDVIPVTSVVTELSHNSAEFATVVFNNGQTARTISVDEVASYVSEAENPGNKKAVLTVSVHLPLPQRLVKLKLVDTPGLDSVLAHNTAASLSWIPNVDLAIVAVSVDPPLSQHDIALIERLQHFSSNICVLLTKVDTLQPPEQDKVLAFVSEQLSSRFSSHIHVFPYSIRHDYEQLRLQFERDYLANVLSSFDLQRSSSLRTKVHALLESVSDYLRLALKAADAQESELQKLRSQVDAAAQSQADSKLQFKLLANHAVARARPTIEGRLRTKWLRQLQKKFSQAFAVEKSRWHGGFAETLSEFRQWLHANLRAELTDVSAAERGDFLEPLRDLQRQYQQELQSLRRALSQRIEQILDIPLHTTEPDIEIEPPRSPDVSVGKIFDHDWETISPLIPMAVFRPLVERHFLAKVEYEVFKNLSRLTSQWEDVIRVAIRATETEAERRFDEFLATVGRLLKQSDVSQRAVLSSFLRRVQEMSDRG